MVVAGVAAAPRPALRALVVDDQDDLAAYRAGWSALVEATSQPFCDPDLLLAWWRHARPARAQLAIVIVTDDAADGSVLGVAPCFCDRGPAGVRWRPLGTQAFQRVQPLAVPGREAEVAAAMAQALHARRARPQVLLFEGVPEDCPWPRLLADAWPGDRSAHEVITGRAIALTVQLDGLDFDGWFGAKSSHFRQRLRRPRKGLAAAGGTFRLADATTAAADIDAFIRLHAGRWAARGGSRAVTPPIAAALRDAGPGLVASGRLRVWSADLHGETIASSLVFRAGDEVGYWLNGFAERYAALQPSKVSFLRVVEDACALRARRLDLGAGDFAYKRRFADGQQTLVHLAVVPRSTHPAVALLAVAAPVLRRELSTRLPDDVKQRLKRAVRHAPAGEVDAAGALSTEVVGDPAALEGCRAEWDALVQATSQPYCAPAWLLAWWRHCAPPGALLAVVVVRDDAGGAGAPAPVVGVAPGFLDRGPAGVRRWRPLGAQACQRVQPLAAPGREAAVARAIRTALTTHPHAPDILIFEGVEAGSPWPALLAGDDARIVRTGTSTAPGMRIDADSLDDWLAGKSAHFRQRLRKDRRTATKQGCVARRAGADDAPAVIEVFLRQHAARWAAEGGSAAVTPGVAATLRDAGPELVRSGVLRLWALDRDGETIATRALFRAGAETGAWLSSYDPEHSRLRPSMVTLLAAVEDAFTDGTSNLDLGEGVFDYKTRFADHEETLLRLTLVPRRPRPGQASRIAAALGPVVARRVVVDRLTDERRAQLRGLLTRLRAR